MDNLNVYVDRLKNGERHCFNEALDPAFLDLPGDELSFVEKVLLKGEAYFVDNHLVIHLNISAPATLPCSICNDPARIEIAMKNLCLTIPSEEIKGAVYNIASTIRESILLQAPLYAECNGGTCPERTAIKSFLTTEARKAPTADKDVVHFPFADL